MRSRRSYFLAGVCGALLLCFAMPAGAAAAVYPVSDATELRSAVETANATPGLADEIVLAPGTYGLAGTGTDGDDDIDIHDSLVLRGGGPGVVLDGEDGFRVLDVYNNPDTVEVHDLTITGGNQFDGTAIKSKGSIVLDNVEIHGNKAGGGGASGFGVIRMFDGAPSLIVRNSHIHDNVVGGGGDGASGFGVINYEIDTTPGKLTIEHSTIDHNRVSENGPFGLGTVKFGDQGSTSGTMTVTDSTISDNTLGSPGMGSSFGGAITFRPGPGSTLTIERSTLARNWASGGWGFGGAIDFHARAGSTMSITNSTLAGNRAGGGAGGGNGYGAAIKFEPENDDGTAILINDTIVGNEAQVPDTVGSAGLDSAGGTVRIGNTILAGNIATHDPDCWNDTPTESLGHNLVGIPGTCTIAGPQDQIGVSPLLGPLAGNGGPTETLAPLPGSPAIDAGDSTLCPATDQRGVTRIHGNCDIGAVEDVPGADMTPGSNTVNGSIAPQQSSTQNSTAAKIKLGSLRIVPSMFRAGDSVLVKFRLSRAARVRLRVEGRTRARTSRFRLLKGSITRRGAAGANSIRFTGRLNGRLLRPGRYRLKVIALDGSRRSKVARAAFRIRG